MTLETQITVSKVTLVWNFIVAHNQKQLHSGLRNHRNYKYVNQKSVSNTFALRALGAAVILLSPQTELSSKTLPCKQESSRKTVSQNFHMKATGWMTSSFWWTGEVVRSYPGSVYCWYYHCQLWWRHNMAYHGDRMHPLLSKLSRVLLRTPIVLRRLQWWPSFWGYLLFPFINICTLWGQYGGPSGAVLLMF